MGLLIGPRGSTQKRMEEASKAKILIRGMWPFSCLLSFVYATFRRWSGISKFCWNLLGRQQTGKGSSKEGAATGHPDDDDQLHVSIEGTDEAIAIAEREVYVVFWRDLMISVWISFNFSMSSNWERSPLHFRRINVYLPPKIWETLFWITLILVFYKGPTLHNFHPPLRMNTGKCHSLQPSASNEAQGNTTEELSWHQQWDANRWTSDPGKAWPIQARPW